MHFLRFATGGITGFGRIRAGRTAVWASPRGGFLAHRRRNVLPALGLEKTDGVPVSTHAILLLALVYALQQCVRRTVGGRSNSNRIKQVFTLTRPSGPLLEKPEQMPDGLKISRSFYANASAFLLCHMIYPSVRFSQNPSAQLPQQRAGREKLVEFQ